MSRVLVGPFNRVEGDLEISLEVAEGKIAAAYVNSPLFRGFEQILLGRPALDALAIVPRICGICSVAQSAAAAQALASAMGITPAGNGALAQRLMQATENLADHLTHFYLFFMPDFTRPAYTGQPWHAGIAPRFTAISGEAAQVFLPARATLLKLMGFLAGRWPHSLALQPGGSTHAITASERLRMLALLREVRSFLEQHLFGDTLSNVVALEHTAALYDWAAGRAADLPRFLQAAQSLGLDTLGAGAARFMSFGAYDVLPAGIWQAGQTRQALDPAAISETTAYTWLLTSPALHPATGETRVDADKPEGYTWCKAPRYGGQIAEVGALARQLNAGNPLLLEMVQRNGGRGSVTARIVARLLEVAQVLPLMMDWINALQAGEPYCTQGAVPDEAQGSGLVEAARGSLGHWLSIRKGRLERYQIIAPTTWNFSPRDAADQPGPLEQALVGLPHGEGSLPLIQHVVRSFDPCMVCTSH